MQKTKVLVMSVGPFEKNGTAKWLKRIQASSLGVVCLPKEFDQFANTYTKNGLEVFIYDEKKYINKDFEFFGFKPRNCGGIGRQGIAEAVDKYGDDFICFQFDDDTSGYTIRSHDKNKASSISSKKELIKIISGMFKFYLKTGICIGGKTGATPPSGSFVSNRKIFNNFLMRKEDSQKGKGFAALCSDDCRYNVYENILELTPTISTELVSISFTQNQGNRDDGNAVIYNSDCSWKKAFSLKIMFPWCVFLKIKKEAGRILFREHIKTSKLYPPICVSDGNGNIIGRVL